MRCLAVSLALLATLAVAGCGETGIDKESVNHRCEPYGGVRSTDWHGDAFVCEDGIVRDI